MTQIAVQNTVNFVRAMSRSFFFHRPEREPAIALTVRTQKSSPDSHKLLFLFRSAGVDAVFLHHQVQIAVTDVDKGFRSVDFRQLPLTGISTPAAPCRPRQR
jgi:hypothetical protein